MRKQLDNRWKQIDKFETSVKTLAEAKVAWRRKLSVKEGELEAIKVYFLFVHYVIVFSFIIYDASSPMPRWHPSSLALRSLVGLMPWKFDPLRHGRPMLNEG